METIFDHNPTPEELRAIGRDWFPRDEYLKLSAESLWFDLALLFRERGDAENEARVWEYIPNRRGEYLRGFDCLELED